MRGTVAPMPLRISLYKYKKRQLLGGWGAGGRGVLPAQKISVILYYTQPSSDAFSSHTLGAWMSFPGKSSLKGRGEQKGGE